MRTTIFVMVLVAGILCSTPVPANAQHCETVGCYTAECWWVGPGHRRCRRVCRRRCWNNDPPYVPPSDPRPYYAPQPREDPTYPPPIRAAPQLPVRVDIQPFVFWGLVGLLGGGVVAATVAAFSGSSIDAEIAKAEQAAQSARGMAKDADKTARVIDQFIATAERHAGLRGRAAADREWTGE